MPQKRYKGIVNVTNLVTKFMLYDFTSKEYSMWSNLQRVKQRLSGQLKEIRDVKQQVQ